MIRQLFVSTFAAICLLIVQILFDGASADGPKQREEPFDGAIPYYQDKSGKSDSDDEKEARSVMWEEPVDLENRDLFYGIGGREGAPDPSGKFKFVRREGSPNDTNEKILVKDDKGREWTVKFGREVRAETAATRIVWAVGYHVDQDYFVKQAYIEGRGGFEVRDVRFERDDDDFKKVGRWKWNSNPFVGTRELDGLKVLMALLNNFDVREGNTKIVRPKKKGGGDPNKHIYYVNDLGATLGTTGTGFTMIPILGLISAGTEGRPHHFAGHKFIDGVNKGEVMFHIKRTITKRELKGVKVENARWMGQLLGRLSEKQLTDAFRAGNFNEEETAIYLRALRDRIKQLQELK